MWIEIIEDETEKHLINLDKVSTIIKDNDGDIPGIRVVWDDGDDDHYDTSYERVAKKLREANVLKW